MPTETKTDDEIKEMLEKDKSDRLADESKAKIATEPIKTNLEILQQAKKEEVDPKNLNPDGTRKVKRPEPWFDDDGNLIKDYDKGIPGSPNEDLDIFAPEPRTLFALPTDEDASDGKKQGEGFKVYKPRWMDEIKIVGEVTELMAKVYEKKMEAGDIDPANPGKMTFDTKEIVDLIKETPEVLTHIVMALTRKDEGWIKENLDFAIILEVVVPFLMKYLPKYGTAVSRFQGAIQSLGITTQT